jgi:hypothetical protein
MGWIGSLAETFIEVTRAPIDNSDATSVRIFICIFPKKRLRWRSRLRLMKHPQMGVLNRTMQ